MKKIMISLLMVAATLTAMAQNFSSFAELTLTSSDNKSCTLILAESADLNAGTNNGYYAELSEEGKAVQLYVIFENKKYEQFASEATTMQNLPLGIKTNASTSYTLTAANVEGSMKVKINGVVYTIDANGTVFSGVTLPANSTLPAASAAADYLVNPAAVAISGSWAWDPWSDFVDNGDGTASVAVELTSAQWYQFGLHFGNTWATNGYSYTREYTATPNFVGGSNDNMSLNADVAGIYTFNWEYATKTFSVTFPAAPAPTYAAEVTTNAYGLATFSFDQPLAPVEAGVKLYKGAISGNDLNLTQVADYAAEQGVVVYGEANTTYHFAAINGATADFSGNELKAASTWAYPHAGTTAYVLSGSSLYIYEGENMKPNKAFLLLEANSGNAPRRISFRFNGTTAFENVEMNEAKAVKFMEDGKVFIKRGDAIYNLQGQLVK